MVVVRIDLHTHSTASDGTDSPAELVAVAAAAGLGAVALTDHDTTAGWRAAVEALPSGMRLVPGAELSCESDDGRGGRIGVHLLAYLFDPQAPAIVAEQRRLRDERRARVRTIADRMADDGLPVDADEILDLVGPEGTAGRPHVAQALVRAGLCETVDEAFANYLSGRRGYYVPRRDTPVEEAIAMISAAGGVTVLAHPFAFGRRPTVAPEVIADLARRGLTGVEVDHPNHDPAAREELGALAKDLGLVRTGSSDYHGTNKTIGIGQETTAVEEFEALVAQATGTGVEVG